MNEEFKQKIQDLEYGLNRLLRIVRNPNIKSHIKRNAIKNIEIQKERIEFFKKGYNFCSKQIVAQHKLV